MPLPKNSTKKLGPDGREYKVFTNCEVLSCDDKTLTIEHFISTESQDDGGDIMRADGMKQRGRVVVLKQHGMDPAQGFEPIAKPKGIRVGCNKKGVKGLIATTQYYDGSKLTPPDNTGQRLYEKAKLGFMPNWSVGYKTIKYTPIKGGRDITEWKLLEYSQVGVGMNEDATCEDEYKALGLTEVDFKKIFDNDRLFTASLEEGKFLDIFADEKDFLANTTVIEFKEGKEMACVGDKCYLIGEGKPYPNEHACRLVEPVANAETRRKNGAQEHEGKKYDVIYQKQGDSWVQQSYRYPKTTWTAAEAKAHCKNHKGRFDAASEKSLSDLTDMRIAFSSLRILFDGVFEELYRQASDETNKDVPSDALVAECLGEFVTLATPYLIAWVDDLTGRGETDGGIEAAYLKFKEGVEKPAPKVDEKVLEEMFAKMRREIETVISEKYVPVGTIDVRAETKKAIESGMFNEFLKQLVLPLVSSGAQRPAKDLYKQAAEGIHFKIGSI
jgi:hypothetical protein